MSKKEFTISIDKKLFTQIQRIAEWEHRSLNSQMEYYLEKCVWEYKKPNYNSDGEPNE